MCVSHDSLLSIVIPRNFVSLTCLIISSPILTSNSAVTVFSLLVATNKYLFSYSK